MKKMIAMIACMLVLVLSLTACGQSAAPETVHSLANGGTLVLRVNPEVAVEYDADGKVTGVTARNNDAMSIVSSCTGLIGQDAREAVAELVTAIGEAGFFVEEIEGERRQIVLEIEPGSSLPHDAFLEDVVKDIRSCVNNNAWHAPLVVNGESDYGMSPYDDTDYDPNSDGVTDFDGTDYDDTDYGPNSDGITDFDGTDYDDTDYGPNHDGVTDFGDTNYDDTDYDDGNSDYNPPAATNPPAAVTPPASSGNTDYGNSDYGNSNYSNSDYGNSDYGDSDYAAAEPAPAPTPSYGSGDSGYSSYDADSGYSSYDADSGYSDYEGES